MKIEFASGTAEKIASKTYSPLASGSVWDHPKALRFKIRRDAGSTSAFDNAHVYVQVRESGPTGERFNFVIGEYAKNPSFVTVTVPLHDVFLEPDSVNSTAAFDLTTNLRMRFIKEGLSDALAIYVDDIEVIELQDINPAAGL